MHSDFPDRVPRPGERWEYWASLNAGDSLSPTTGGSYVVLGATGKRDGDYFIKDDSGDVVVMSREQLEDGCWRFVS